MFLPLDEVGDATPIAWGIFCAYFAAAWLCYRAATRCRGNRYAELAAVWCGLAGVLVLLGLNKQLDFQLWLTAVGRWLAKTQGWYEHREVVHVLFFVVVALGVTFAWLSLVQLAWRRLRQVGLALFGAMLLAVFILVRAVSFDLFDLRVPIAGTTLHEILETVGVLVVGFSAATFRPAAHRDPHRLSRRYPASPTLVGTPASRKRPTSAAG